MPVIVIRELDVCHDCACLIANGEVGDQEETEAQAAAIESHYGPNWGRIVLACDEDECDRVAVGPCDTCGQGESGYYNAHPAAELSDGPAPVVTVAECVAAVDGDGPWVPSAEDRTVSIPRGTQHLTSDAVWAMLAEREGRSEISDACAAAIASWWQTPRGPGEAFTRLVSHFAVTVAR